MWITYSVLMVFKVDYFYVHIKQFFIYLNKKKKTIILLCARTIAKKSSRGEEITIWLYVLTAGNWNKKAI